MKQKNKTKIIVDRIAFLGLFSCFIVMEAYYMYKLTGNEAPLFLLYSVIAILVIGLTACAVTTKKYGPYNEKGEETPSLWMIFIMVFLTNRVSDIFFAKADVIAETATDITIGFLQITGLLVVFFALMVILIKAEMHFEKRYNQWKKQKELNKADTQ